MTMLTTEQLNAIKERAEKATAGPWEARKWSGPTNDQFFVRQSGESETKEIATAWQGVRYPRMPEICGEEAKANAIFIAHAREDIPALLQTVEALTAILAETEETRDKIGKDWSKLLDGRVTLKAKIATYESLAQEFDYGAILDEMDYEGCGSDD